MGQTKGINLSWKRKRCAKCRKWKTLKNFWRNRADITGYEPYCKACSQPHKDKWYKANKVKSLASGLKHRKRYRHEALAHYCGGTPYCQCPNCNVTEERFLTLDHINNDGARHRRELSKGKSNKTWLPLYTWARRNNYPPIFQVLCYNCNCGRQLNGGTCPHMEETQVSFAQPFSESHSIQTMIQLHKTDGNSGGSSSPILTGTEDPGVTVAHPSETLHLRRTKDRAAHPGLRRKYASTGSGGGKS